MRDEADDGILIEGYASLFGKPDQSGDIVRAGAFSQSLKARGLVPMLLQHKDGARGGKWVRMFEDGRGLFVRGMVESDGGRRLLGQGLNGLSIGFQPRLSRALASGGRELIQIDLFEISLVHDPMLEGARFSVLGRNVKLAA